MDISEDCWVEHVGLLQEVPGTAEQQHSQQMPPAPDFLMMQHSHHHEVGIRISIHINYSDNFNQIAYK
jgi:hypothetical protein